MYTSSFEWGIWILSLFVFCSYESEEGGSQDEEYSSTHSY